MIKIDIFDEKYERDTIKSFNLSKSAGPDYFNRQNFVQIKK